MFCFLSLVLLEPYWSRFSCTKVLSFSSYRDKSTSTLRVSTTRVLPTCAEGIPGCSSSRALIFNTWPSRFCAGFFCSCFLGGRLGATVISFWTLFWGVGCSFLSCATGVSVCFISGVSCFSAFSDCAEDCTGFSSAFGAGFACCSTFGLVGAVAPLDVSFAAASTFCDVCVFGTSPRCSSGRRMSTLPAK